MPNKFEKNGKNKTLTIGESKEDLGQCIKKYGVKDERNIVDR